MKKNILFCICVFLKAIDIITTYFLVECFGYDSEANPLVRWTIATWGLPIAMVVNFLFFSSIVILAYKINKVYIFWPMIAVLSIVAVNNSFVVWNVLK